VAKLLGLGYPGGPIVDRLAPTGDPKAVRLPPPRMSDGSLDFSFSGFKTAVLRHAQARHLQRDFPAAGEPSGETRDLLASFQSSVVEFMVDRLMTVAERESARAVCLSGGVACNSLLRRRAAEEAERAGVGFFCVSRALAVDNAAMIAGRASPVPHHGGCALTSCWPGWALVDRAFIAISASSPTSITARPRSPIASWRSAAPSPSAT
jgi:N6-L-threonylcarbamoyladenine synthase